MEGYELTGSKNAPKICTECKTSEEEFIISRVLCFTCVHEAKADSWL